MGAVQPGDVDAILLAGGRSARMGMPKGLFPVQGRPWIEHQLDAIDGARLRAAIVVLGFDAERYVTAIPGLTRRARVVVNEAPERGPFSSLQCGLRAVTSAAAFVLPVDVPAAAPEVWQALADVLSAGETVDGAVPEHDGRGGHPVLLGPALIAAISARAPTSRLDEELRAHVAERGRGSVARVPVADRRVGLNLNGPEDWGQLQER
jgi:CTP:molybdopterin cytidylyltransferase MocA